MEALKGRACLVVDERAFAESDLLASDSADLAVTDDNRELTAECDRLAGFLGVKTRGDDGGSDLIAVSAAEDRGIDSPPLFRRIFSVSCGNFDP